MANVIPIEVKKTCCQMKADGKSVREIYDEYFKQQFEKPQAFNTFSGQIHRWMKLNFPDEITLDKGTYDGFVAHNATVQVSKDGEIIQAWIKQKASDFDPEEFLNEIRKSVEPYEYTPSKRGDSFHMLEIPLFDMHWGVAFMDHYEPVLNDLLDLIHSHTWHKIVIPFGQDFFHNDSVVNGQTTKGTTIEKVDMIRAVKEGREFIYTIIDAAIAQADEVKVLYSAGNHDRSISWMFVQVLLERYGSSIVDDSITNRKVITYGKNAVMVTHGDSRRANPSNLAHIFPIMFPDEFTNANVREVHSGHLHHETNTDVYGVMVRRLSSGNKADEWSDQEDYVGAHRRFTVFNWSLEKLKSIHYI